MNIRVTSNGLSIVEAIQKTREDNCQSKTIIVEEGNYFIEDPIILNAKDQNLVIKGEGKAHLFGGKQIKGWRKEGKYFKASLQEVKDDRWDFRMLIVNDRYADRARYPEKDYLLHNTDFDVHWKSTYEGGFERDPSYEELTTLKFDKETLPKGTEAKNAEFTVYHMWDESLVGVKSIDWDTQTIRFKNPSGWPPGAFTAYYKIDKRYVVWNTEEGMLHPGQWYLDRVNGDVVYWPLEGENLDTLSAFAPNVERVFVIGDEKGEIVKDITIENLSISATNAPLMSGAFGAKLFDGAISICNAKNLLLNNLEVYNVGAHCIKAAGDDIKIEGCKLHHAGAGAIRIVGSRANVYNNYIHHIGRTFPSAIALYVGATDPNVPEEWIPGQAYTDCKVVHNELHDVPYAAICAGGKNLIIEKNLIYNAMQDLYDGAGIYITFCQNAKVKGNFIRDIKDAPGAGTSAYYLDEKSDNCIIEENIEINVARPSHNHISSNNTFRNNFFIIKGKGWFSLERSEGYVFENNIMLATEGFDFFDLKACKSVTNNIFYSGNGPLLTRELDMYDIKSEYEMPLKDGNVNTDPLLENYKDGKIRFCSNSIAKKMGIKEIDVSDAGLIK